MGKTKRTVHYHTKSKTDAEKITDLKISLAIYQRKVALVKRKLKALRNAS